MWYLLLLWDKVSDAWKIMNCTEYDTVYLSPDSTSWNPTSNEWAAQENILLDSNGEIPSPIIKQPTQLIGENDAEICSVEVFEQAIDQILVSLCESNPQDDSLQNKDWLLIEDPLRAHIAASEPLLDYTLLGADVNERVVQSKIMAAASSTTTDISGCELFEAATNFKADISSFIGAASASKPTYITAETLSKIWRIDQVTAAHTFKVLSQLNHQGGSENLSWHFGTNDWMLQYRMIASEFHTDTFFVTDKAHSTRGYTCMQILYRIKALWKSIQCEK